MIIDSRPKLPQPAVVNVSFTTPGEAPSVPPSPTSTLVESTPPPYDVRFSSPTRCTPASLHREHSDLENAERKHRRRRNWLKLVFRVAFCIWVIPSAYVALTVHSLLSLPSSSQPVTDRKRPIPARGFTYLAIGKTSRTFRDPCSSSGVDIWEARSPQSHPRTTTATRSSFVRQMASRLRGASELPDIFT
jgi:hypothetical protein